MTFLSDPAHKARPTDRRTDPAQSIQDLFIPHRACFGCGSDNAHGLQLRSFPGETTVEATFTGLPHHGNGMGSLNGGIISTLLDCHSAAAAMHGADRRGWSGPDGSQRFVTAALDVRFRRPAPVGQPLQLSATVTSAGPDEMFMTAELTYDGKALATATSRFVRLRRRPSV